jgi:hypothetical protein
MILQNLYQTELSNLYGWDLKNVKNRMKKDNPSLDEDYLSALEIEYKRYISLLLFYPKSRRPISAFVDEMWHTHLLFTKDYSSFSNAIIGQFIHHCPSEGREQTESMKPRYMVNTITEYEQIYGKASTTFWPRLFDGESECSSSNCD